MGKTRQPKNQDGEKVIGAGKVELTIKRVPNDPSKYMSLYVNDTQVQVTPWDFRIIFGLVGDPPTTENRSLNIATIGEVRMSPQHMKRVAKLVLGQIEAYEKFYGPITEPKEG